MSFLGAKTTPEELGQAYVHPVQAYINQTMAAKKKDLYIDTTSYRDGKLQIETG